MKVMKNAKVIDTYYEEENERYTKLLDGCVESVITLPDGSEMRGYLFGDDEMFDFNEFYHLFYSVADKKIYKAYYDQFDEDGNEIRLLEDVDYDHPYKIKELEDFCVEE